MNKETRELLQAQVRYMHSVCNIEGEGSPQAQAVIACVHRGIDMLGISDELRDEITSK